MDCKNDSHKGDYFYFTYPFLGNVRNILLTFESNKKYFIWLALHTDYKEETQRTGC
jgi:hypothetical protein